MKLDICVNINSGAAWVASFLAMNIYAFHIGVAFSEYWIAIAALYGWHSGRRLWRELKTPGGTVVTAAEEEAK